MLGLQEEYEGGRGRERRDGAGASTGCTVGYSGAQRLCAGCEGVYVGAKW
jgi:hypothetical protein